MNQRSIPCVLMIRREMRLTDNPALHKAFEIGQGNIIPLIIRDKQEVLTASQFWEYQAIKDLSESYQRAGARLILKTGDVYDSLKKIMCVSGAQTIVWTKATDPKQSVNDQKLKEKLEKNGYMVVESENADLFSPEKIRTNKNTPYRVFTAYYHACLKGQSPQFILKKPDQIKTPQEIETEKVTAWAQDVVWTKKINESWTVTEEKAHEILERFIKKTAKDYEENRNIPSLDGTSRLSPYLHWGQISVRQIAMAIEKEKIRTPAAAKGLDCFWREVIWRSFSENLLHYFPEMDSKPLDPRYASFPWKQDATSYKAWKEGKTGYPLIDAGMRQLWETGWMHNRVRMIVASFLIKDLLLPWQQGAKWFLETLVDADRASNSANWQWVAGCGADPAPFFRIFNPVSQSKKFDPEGIYIRRYVPELKGLPLPYLHEPWRAPQEILDQARVKLGKDYPLPIVDHAHARNQALMAYKNLPR